MLRKIVQLLFFLTGITVGIFLVPELLRLVTLDDVAFLNNPYMSAVIGALIFYLCLYWTVDYVIDGIIWLEEKLIRLPIVDIIVGSHSHSIQPIELIGDSNKTLVYYIITFYFTQFYFYQI